MAENPAVGGFFNGDQTVAFAYDFGVGVRGYTGDAQNQN